MLRIARALHGCLALVTMASVSVIPPIQLCQKRSVADNVCRAVYIVRDFVRQSVLYDNVMELCVCLCLCVYVSVCLLLVHNLP